MGLALPILAPGGVASALTHWGSADQQATYLQEFAGENVPAGLRGDRRTARAVRPDRAEDHGRPHPERLPARTASSRWCPPPPTPNCSSSAPNSTASPRCSSSSRPPRGCPSRPTPAWASARAALGRVELDNVAVPLSARLGEDDATDADYSEAIALARLGWAALAVGTSHAVLDYVIPYVKEREAFGEPIAHRQSVAFMCANIAIELDGLRLITWRGAVARRAGPAVRPRGRAGQAARHRQGHADRPRRRPAARRPRLHQGTPGRTLVPRPARDRRRRGRRSPLTASSSFEAERPDHGNQSGNAQEAAGGHREGPPGRRRDAAADLAQVRPQRARLSRRARHPGHACSRASRRRRPSRSPAPRRSATRDGKDENHNGGNMSALLNALEISWGDVALLLSVPYQGLGNAAISGVATDEQLERLGKVWAAMAITEPSFGSDSAAVSTTANARRRRVRHQRREDLRHRRFARHPHRGVGDAGQVAGPRRDQVVHRAARASRASPSSGSSTSSASRPPTPR